MAYRPTPILSIQTGSIDMNGVTTNTATITAVVVANSILYLTGQSTGSAGTNVQGLARITLTNTTTVTATSMAALGTATPVTFTVVEYRPRYIKSIQRGTIDVNGGTTAMATITSVDTTKSFVVPLGWTLNSAIAMALVQLPDLRLTNATTVTARVGADPGVAQLVGYEVVEFY